MGTIYRARDHARRRCVAVKILRHVEATDLGRFEREASLLAALSHPAIVRFVDHGVTEDGDPFLVMEWLDGENLRTRLAAPGVTAAEAVEIVRRVAAALGEAHRHGVVHRDVKPENLICRDGALDRVTLIDFGLARRDTTHQLTRTGVMVGTLAYMAPEQARGERVDARADVFALGCVLYECLAGVPAFAGATEYAVWAKVLFCDPLPLGVRCPEARPALLAIVSRMMARTASERFADGEAVAAALAAPALTGPGGRRRSTRDAIVTPVTEPLIGVAQLTCVVLVDGGDRAGAPRAALAGLDVQAEPLAGGGLVVIFRCGTPIERAELAARAARAIARAAPGKSIAIAGAIGSLDRAIERTAALLTEAAIDRAVASSAALIVIDDVVAGLLAGRVAIDRVRGHCVLVDAGTTRADDGST